MVGTSAAIVRAAADLPSGQMKVREPRNYPARFRIMAHGTSAARQAQSTGRASTRRTKVHWLNEPAHWSAVPGLLTITADAGTDFWRTTSYGYVRDNGHLYGEVLGGDFDLSMRLSGAYADQYDQAGAMVRVDERHWLKTGVEYFDGRARFSTVVTNDHSSWAVADLPAGPGELGLLLTRRGDAVEVRYAVGGGEPELAALVYLPPGAALAGAMCAAPEGGGFRAAFHDLTVTPR
jgi:regulation of enolase protein 1 (concanavalin A-like superfamily)